MGEDTSVPVGDVDPESEELSDEDLATIRSVLTADEANERQRGTRTCRMVADENPEAIGPLVDDLAALLDDESAAVAQQAGNALLSLAAEHPGELTDVVPAIVGLTKHDVNAIQWLGARIFAAVVVEHPEAGASSVDRLFPALYDHPGSFEPSEGVNMVENQETRETMVRHEQEEYRMKLQTLGTLANAIVAVAEAEPPALFDHVDDLRDLLDHDDAPIVGAAVDALAAVARADADVAAPAFDDLVDLLDHDDQRVRARAVRALGFLGDERAVEPLRELAASEDDEDAVELAEETAAFLEN